MNALGPSLASYVRSSRTLKKWAQPIAAWYTDLMGYRKLGLKADDLQVEEFPEVQRALGRLSPREYYDRAYRFKVASQQSVLHKALPKEKWIPASEDKRYLKPHVEAVITEESERAAWDNLEVKRK